MLQFFRNFFKSKLGIPVTLVFLVVIAFAFASMDVSNTAMFGGVSGGDRVAVVGDERISTSELQTNINSALDQARQQNPTLTMQAFLAGGGMEQVLDQVMQRAAIAEFAREHGLRAGDRLVDSEILQIPAFRGADGTFDQDTFLAVLRQQGLSEQAVREDIATGLLARQLLTPASYATVLPRKMALQYAKLLRERREGAIAMLESARFAPEGDPTSEQLQTYYSTNRNDYTRPERRVVRYATFGEEALGDLPTPTDAQIAARYEQNAAQYRASESRTFTQLVAPTQAAAEAIVEEVRGGTSLATSAQAKGLATTTVGPVTQEALANQASAAVAQAAFSAGEGAVASPARGSLGWYVLRVDDVERQSARSLAQVRDEISTTLAAEQRQAAFLDLAERIEEEVDSGRSLPELADEFGLELESTRPVTADGRVYGTDETAPEVLAQALPTAFDMDEEEPQVAPVVPNERYLVFEVTDITQSAPAPLTEIREQVVADWRRTQGSEAAKAAAERIMQRLSNGQSMAEALAAEDVALPPAENVALGREELAQMPQVPPVLALFFSMAEGTVKRLEGPNSAGWFVVQLDDIETPDIEANDPLIATTMQQLGQAAGDEYTQQLVAALGDEVGMERNEAAIEALATQLVGQGQ